MKAMHVGLLAFALAAGLALGGCGEDEAEVPEPHAVTAEATGHYCNMLLSEHEGPKGQIFLKSEKQPIWFSSVRDTITFTLLPEEPKDIAAIYVTDMTTTEWSQPGDDSWIDARDAFYVIGSDRAGGMGAPEAVPFKAEHDGEVVRYDGIPKDYILAPVEPDAASPDETGHDQEHHDTGHGEGEGHGS
jgi:copper chaperone NosL